MYVARIQRGKIKTEKKKKKKKKQEEKEKPIESMINNGAIACM